MSFAEVREYRIGDDVRDIDWNVTARSRKPHIKVYEEERELTMMLVVDVSGSGSFGSTDKTKRDVMTEVAAVLAFSAAQNNDKVGCLLFSDKVEKFIPPKKSHGLTGGVYKARERIHRAMADARLLANPTPIRTGMGFRDLHPVAR